MAIIFNFLSRSGSRRVISSRPEVLSTGHIFISALVFEVYANPLFACALAQRLLLHLSLRLFSSAQIRHKCFERWMGQGLRPHLHSDNGQTFS